MLLPVGVLLSYSVITCQHMLLEKQLTISMRSNFGEWTHFLLQNTLCSNLYSFYQIGLIGGLEIRVTFTQVSWEKPVCVLLDVICWRTLLQGSYILLPLNGFPYICWALRQIFMKCCYIWQINCKILSHVKILHFERYQVHKTVNIKISVSWIIQPRSLVDDRGFRGICCCHHQSA